MKRILLIILSSFLFCSTGFAISVTELVNEKFEGRKLENIEGVWIVDSDVHVIYKENTNYFLMTMVNGINSCKEPSQLNKISNNLFLLKTYAIKLQSDFNTKKCERVKSYPIDYTYHLYSYQKINYHGKASDGKTWMGEMIRVWPEEDIPLEEDIPEVKILENIIKELEIKIIKLGGKPNLQNSDQVVLIKDLSRQYNQLSVDEASNVCKLIGHTAGTITFKSCIENLYKR